MRQQADSDSKVVLLMGGRSPERDISLMSGQRCSMALRQEGFNVVEIDVSYDLSERLKAEGDCVAFNALHGRWGEDGCIQGLLEFLEIPYTHSGVLSSALAMDKERAKVAYRSAGLPAAASQIHSRHEVSTRHVMVPPYVVKPIDSGSSLDIHIVLDSNELPPSLSEDMPAMVMVEDYIPGRELTTTVLVDQALAVTEIVTEGWYDFEAKYTPGGSHHILPAAIPTDVYDTCLDYAYRAHAALLCRGVSRTDFRWNEAQGKDGLVLLETNTQPGLTPFSLTPEQAEFTGLSFDKLCRLLVEDASCAR
ncbi:MAG: D-alanine--D-alanine ligase [Aestuariivita sp.]|nr:D-alanine--D-alanine ligase [Aestuariivita sp.]